MNIYLSPVLLQTWLEDSVSIQRNLRLKYESLGCTEQDGAGRDVRVIAEIPPHSCHFMTSELARLETQRHEYILIKNLQNNAHSSIITYLFHLPVYHTWQCLNKTNIYYIKDNIYN